MTIRVFTPIYKAVIDVLPRPIINSATPNSGNQNQTLNVVLAGKYLIDAQTVEFWDGGITVNSFLVNSDTQITANITIAEFCPPGLKNILVTSPDGTGILLDGFTVVGIEHTLVVEATHSGYIMCSGENGDTYYYVHHNALATYDPETWPLRWIGQFYDAAIPRFYVMRDALIFDTPVPSGAVITGATLSLYGREDCSDTDFDIVIVSGADLADILVKEDYGDLLNAITSFGQLTSVGLVIEGWNVITLNALGVAAITKGGTTRFGLRSSRDISITTPKLNAGDADESVRVYDHTVANKKPKLTITYTL